MHQLISRGVAALLLVMALVALASCGSSGSDSNNPKVSDAAFIPYCVRELKSKPATNAGVQALQARAREFCTCGQQKFEAAGDGDKHAQDPALKGANDLGAACAKQVLAGASPPTGGTSSNGSSAGTSSTP